MNRSLHMFNIVCISARYKLDLFHFSELFLQPVWIICNSQMHAVNLWDQSPSDLYRPSHSIFYDCRVPTCSFFFIPSPVLIYLDVLSSVIYNILSLLKANLSEREFHTVTCTIALLPLVVPFSFHFFSVSWPFFRDFQYRCFISHYIFNHCSAFSMFVSFFHAIYLSLVHHLCLFSFLLFSYSTIYSLLSILSKVLTLLSTSYNCPVYPTIALWHSQ